MTISDKEYELRNLEGFESDGFIKKELNKLIKKHKISLVIETGTFKGGSTKQFSAMVNRVITTEINSDFFKQAKNFLKECENVEMICGDSLNVLSGLVINNLQENILFFLDDHWLDKCPLIDELEIIATLGIKPVIAIHDFYVPGTNFGYDTYKGQRFDWEFVREAIERIYGKDNFNYFYNEQAEGAARGIIYIEPK